jgi:hypothetical protein
MIDLKYTVSIINSKWEPIKRNIKIEVLPRKDEYLFFDEKYHLVLNLVHRLSEKHEIFIIIEEVAKMDSINNEKK